MSRTQRIAITTLLLGAGAAQAHAQAGTPLDVRSIKPVMMLLVDTSGSMERMTNDTRLPDCQNDVANDATEKNRWAVTLEALTGTYPTGTFKCEEIDRATLDTDEMDYGYYLPHFAITSAVPPASDGILDAFMYRIKFGLMTFDGTGTTLTGDSLVAHSVFISSAYQVLSTGPEGMYSYGDHDNKLMFPGCEFPYGFDAGARRAATTAEGTFPGALVSVGLDDDGTAVAAVNAKIQAGLKEVRPFGSTPLAAMFDDLDYYITNEPDVRQGSDPYYGCRDRYALLLTDSAGDANELFRDERFRCDQTTGCETTGGVAVPCECPYKEDIDIVQSLTAGGTPKLKQLFVLAFNVDDADALVSLDKLAQAGKSDADEDTPGNQAFRAATPAELRQRLSELMSNVQREATSRSIPVSVDTGSSVLLGGRQYEITSGFAVGDTDDQAWSGLLYRRRIGCDDNSLPTEFELDPEEGDLIHETLNEQIDSTRLLYTLAPTVSGSTNASAARGTLRTTDAVTDAPTPAGGTTNDNQPENGLTFSGALLDDSSIDDDQALVDTGLTLVPFTDASALNSNYFGDADGLNGAGDPADRAKIVEYVRGLSRENKLADIYHSQPAVLPPLTGTSESLASSDERVSQFKSSLLALDKYAESGRPGVIFVGTNDGILHAFNLEDTTIDGTDYPAGYEFWGFVPPALFSKMHNAATPTHQTMFDGSPVIADIMAPRDDGSVTTPTFSTVLVSAVRGAPAFVALDVTQPEQLKVLWQFSDPFMGDTVGNPAVTHVMVNWKGTVQQRAVAILPGGQGTTPGGACPLSTTASEALFGDEQRDQGRCWQARGRALYVVDIATGELIQRFDARHFNAPLTGSVTADTPGLGVSTAAYLTDQDGILWRLSMLNSDAEDWRVQPVWDLFGEAAYDGGRPSTFPPLVTRDPSGNVVIVVGTGDIDNLVDTAQHRVLSLTEQRAVDSTGELSGDITRNWRILLEPGESVTGPLVLFEQTVYFGTFSSLADPADACAFGSSTLFGAHYRETDPAATDLPRPMLAPDADNDGVLDPGADLVLSDDTNNDTLVLGVAITRQPICLAGEVENDPNFFNLLGNGGTAARFSGSGAASGGKFKLKALAGGTGGERVGGSEIHQVSQDLQVNESTSVAAWAGSVE